MTHIDIEIIVEQGQVQDIIVDGASYYDDYKESHNSVDIKVIDKDLIEADLDFAQVYDDKIRENVLQAYSESVNKYESLYEKLSKKE